MISDLIFALCGESYEDAKSITEQIKETGDVELIEEAEYINSIL